mmetsp:Transcript_56952/g.68173  ORF Transcript_56952/g.68173 Transcript_56952/m.68173 type:complete len:162 (-) Transcript_56952:16-501(-)|eukprot:CAMPEP_0172499458 /NCGR_PEP_ID=MMETSP1066-20121228/127464_1 /TAXON_ID=671091 /ORGANISM="Coscinodiscus wailesii, Strain CCMP2513" /LENGTH=161 /DNA_ID=CAMNT_0013273215 /DNA_START=128 /DNA_END=613 /DNA_ORIENTATION=+
MKKPTVLPIESVEELTTYFDESTRKLLIIDIHLSWSGSCESTLGPTFNSIVLNTDRGDERLAILSVQVPKYWDALRGLLLNREDADAAGSTTSAAAAAITNGKGIDVNSLKVGHERGCSPLFIAVRDQKIVGVVEGADAPALEKIVEEHIPKVSDDDDDEP